MNFSSMNTESRNDRTMHIDELSIKKALQLMNEEDRLVAEMVGYEIDHIERAIEFVVDSFKKEGRLIYVGAGTSGRIGLLDAVECVPTFSVDSTQVQGLIAGGSQAFIKAVEGAEDSFELGAKDLKGIQLCKDDTVIGIAASGRTPYVKGALDYANEVGAHTVALSCNKKSEISDYASVKIEVDTGAEVITGSTRLKAGTAQKLVCNMISTISMIQLGKVYGNLMVDLQPTNFKLVERAKRIIMQATDCDYETADQLLEASRQQPKTAIVMYLLDCDYDEAVKQLQQHHQHIKPILKEEK
ncbi:N-acetylmuramic acid 6-phosphate etherase [Kurthia senegalensis]|uniref:N-acetylmuramic acid 6-phosphate etherase n=1 Tax=Kurthia senegalensis TaxID=1033740 RepID=UPI000287C778|nr:N-acetylmuramic acid 6-phosphate etherase [Kurthia senegalensis]